MKSQYLRTDDLQFRNILPFQNEVGSTVSEECSVDLTDYEPDDAVFEVYALITDRCFFEASDAAIKFVELRPDLGHALLCRAITDYELRVQKGVIQDLDKAERDCNHHPLFHLYRGRILRGKNQLRQSGEHFVKAFNLATNASLKTEAKIGQILSQAAAKETVPALENLQLLLNADPKSQRLKYLKYAISEKDEKLPDESALSRLGIKLESFKESIFAKKIVRNPEIRLEDRPLIANYPFTVADVELTNHCPMKCVMCPRTNHMSRPLGHMSFDTFKKVFDELEEANGNNFSKRGLIWLHNYGESLVHPEFDRLIKYARGKGASVGLSVNSIMLTDKTANRLLEAEPTAILLPLDGHDDESFLKIRGIPDAYEKSKKRALEFIEKKHQSNSRIRLHVIMVDFPKNSNSISEVTDFWSNVPGVDKFIPKKFTTWDGSLEDINSLAPEIEDTPQRSACNYPWSKMSILWNGDVVVCCHDFDGKNIVGNINSSSLEQIWNGNKMKRLRAQLKANGVFNEVCQNCEYSVSS